MLLLAFTGCGGRAAVHYNVPSALDCLQRTDSTLFHRLPGGILIGFISPDGVSAIEPVAVAFAPQGAELVARSQAPTRLGSTKPTWTEHRGDAEVWGLGPYEPPIAKRQHIPDSAARAAAKVLDARVRPAIDACLKANER
jgi:hypothetical protein